MGRAKRLHREAVIAGEEKPIRHEQGRTDSPSDDNSEFLQVLSSFGRMNAHQIMVLRDTILRRTPIAVKESIQKRQQEGKEVTADVLLGELRAIPGFVAVCNKVGIADSWFREVVSSCVEGLSTARPSFLSRLSGLFQSKELTTGRSK